MFRVVASIPRETRDTLFLLHVIAFVLIALAAYVPVWCTAFAILMLLWRGCLAWSAKPLPARPWLFFFLTLTLAATAITHGTLLGRDAGVTLIVALLALKTLELRAHRDAFVVFFLGLFTLLTSFFFSQSLLTAIAVGIAMLGLMTALVNSQMSVGRPPLLQAAKIALKMILLGAPLMALLFVFFPRIAPLWGIQDQGMGARNGLSSSMRVGSIGALAVDDNVAMRVKFHSTPPDPSELYFRGPVLSFFDGLEWQPFRSGFPKNMQLSADLKLGGTPFFYTITQEPSHQPWLLVLDGTVDKPDLPGFSSHMTAELQWVTNRPIHDLVRYTVKSYSQFSHGPLRPMTGLQDYVELPPGFNPRTLALALDLRSQPRYAQADAMTLVQAVLEKLRHGGYSYTLEPGLFGQHTADEFWFERKQGFCEHIASAFVILMRALDIPARIVTGYQGGELNPVDDFWTVRNRDAHAWAEVWVENLGWIRVDPTAAVAPTRVLSLQRLRPAQGIFAGAMGAVSPRIALGLRTAWDALNNRWNQWILNYSQARQLSLLKSLGFQNPGWEDLTILLTASVAAFGFCISVIEIKRRLVKDPWLAMLESTRKRLLIVGLNLPSHASPRQIADQMQNTLQDNSSNTVAIKNWLVSMEEWRYSRGPHPSGLTLHQLRRDFKQLIWPK